MKPVSTGPMHDKVPSIIMKVQYREIERLKEEEGLNDAKALEKVEADFIYMAAHGGRHHIYPGALPAIDAEMALLFTDGRKPVDIGHGKGKKGVA